MRIKQWSARLWAIVAAAAVALTMAPAAFAAGEEPSKTADFSGDTVGVSKAIQTLGGSACASWNAETKTLTLTNVNYEAEGDTATALVLPGDSTIELKGDNSLTAKGTVTGNEGGVLLLKGNTTVKATSTASLTVTANGSQGTVAAIKARGSFTMQSHSATVTAFGSTFTDTSGESVKSRGMVMESDAGNPQLNINAGTLNLTGGSVTNNNTAGKVESYGLELLARSGGIRVMGGAKLNATGGGATAGSGLAQTAGVKTASEINIDGASTEFNATGGDAEVGVLGQPVSYGLYVENYFTVNGGKVNCAAGEVAGGEQNTEKPRTSVGIFVQNSKSEPILKIKGGTVKASCVSIDAGSGITPRNAAMLSRGSTISIENVSITSPKGGEVQNGSGRPPEGTIVKGGGTALVVTIGGDDDDTGDDDNTGDTGNTGNTGTTTKPETVTDDDDDDDDNYGTSTGTGVTGSTSGTKDQQSSNVSTSGAPKEDTLGNMVEKQFSTGNVTDGDPPRTDVKVRNAKFVTPEGLAVMNDAAKKNEGESRLLADTTENNVLVGRMYLDAAKADGVVEDIQLGVHVGEKYVREVREHFGQYYKNKTAVVSMDHQGAIGMRAQVAAKVDLTGMDKTNLHFYSYNRGTNTYVEILNPSYYVDRNGYIHFFTDMAGDIIISEGKLEK